MRIEAWVRSTYARANKVPQEGPALDSQIADAMALWVDIPDSEMPDLLIQAARKAGRFVPSPAEIARLWDERPKPATKNDLRLLTAAQDRELEAKGGKPSRDWVNQWAEETRKQYGWR
jgi:hypothetical protein